MPEALRLELVPIGQVLDWNDGIGTFQGAIELKTKDGLYSVDAEVDIYVAGFESTCGFEENYRSVQIGYLQLWDSSPEEINLTGDALAELAALVTEAINIKY